LTAVICVGETLEEKYADRTFDILADQIAQSIPKKETDRIVVAYEPMWAIGTGNTPPLSGIGQAHKYIRSVLLSQLGSTGIDVPVVYGGSVKPSNAFEILQIDDVGGLLVGGASLDAGQFKAIFQAALISNSETA
jgi:triosephosphate isomerase